MQRCFSELIRICALIFRNLHCPLPSKSFGNAPVLLNVYVLPDTCVRTFTCFEGLLGPEKIYLCKVNKRSIRKRCKIRSNSTMKTSGRRQGRRSGVFNVNFDHISYLLLVFLLLTLNMYLFAAEVVISFFMSS